MAYKTKIIIFKKIHNITGALEMLLKLKEKKRKEKQEEKAADMLDTYYSFFNPSKN